MTMKQKTILMWMLLFAATHVMGITVTVNPVTIEAGQSTEIVINLVNTETTLTGYQMSLYLPDGITLLKKTNGKYKYTLSSRHEDTHTMTINDDTDGSLLIVCYSADKDVISGNSGELLRLPVDVASTVTTSLQGSLKKIKFGDTSAQGYVASNVTIPMSLPDSPEIPPVVDGNVEVSVPDVQMTAGGQAEIVVNLTNDLSTLTGYQMSLYLPDGVTLQKKTNGKYKYTLSSRHEDTHTMTIQDDSDGSLLIVCYSADKDVISGNSGELLRLPVDVASTVTTSLQGSLKTIKFADTSAQGYVASNVTFKFSLQGQTPPSDNITFADPKVKALCVANWDTNGDGELSEAEAAAVTTLGEVFKENKEITSFDELRFFTGLTSISRTAFGACLNLASVIIPDGVLTIEDGAFIACQKLTSIVIPNSVTSLGICVFENCQSLEAITIPNSVTFIDKYSFRFCGSLGSVNLSKNLTTLSEDLFDNCPNLVSITIPEGVTTIEDGVFDECDGLTFVNLPSSLTSIGKYAFRFCFGLSSLTIPSGVSTIGSKAFDHCNSLTSVIVENRTPIAITDDVFSNHANATLYVPVGCKAAYEAAANWQDFQKIVESGRTVTWAVTSTDEIPAGTVIELEDIIMTIGEAGSPNFTVDTWDTYDEPFTKRIEGNGVNGNKEGGTFYIFTPKKNGDLTVVVRQNVGGQKKFYVEECGRVMDAFNGILPETTDDVYIGTYTIPVFANLTYKIYCAGSKMGFYGFIFEGRDDAEWTNIEFVDEKVKALCVANWDTDHNGELSMTEAAAVTDLGEVFKGNRDIIHFDELRFFIGVKEMPEWVTFVDCENLYSITIPASVISLGGATFANCRNLNEIYVDARNSVYDSRLGCHAIIETATNTLVVGSPNSNMYNVKTIGPASFWGRNVPILNNVIPETVTSIGAHAFTWSSIEEFSMPTTIEDIGFQAFGYTPLKSITLPSSLKTLGEEAFRNCEEMTSVTIPDNLEEISDSCFKYCTKLESIDLKNVKKIGGGAFGSTGLTSLVLPASVKEVCDEAFCWCPIATLDLGQVEKVGNLAFMSTAIEELTIPATLTEVGVETFSWNFSMKKAIFQDGCTKVFDTMFHGNENLSEVVLPNTITEIQNCAFRACKSLSTVAWPNKLERIGEVAFQESGITSAVLPISMKWIDNQAFNKCQELVDVDIVRIEHLGYNAFSECPKIKKICLPSTIVIDENSWAAFSPSGLETVEFFEGTTRIDNLTFAGCENLKNLPYGLPSTLESIGHNAFTECKSLESVTIPQNVNWIQEEAFKDCSKLTSVISRIPDPTNMTFEDGVFTGISENAVLYVPKGTISAYTQTGWTQYFAQVLEEPDNTLYPQELSTHVGKQTTLAIAMDNDSKITAIQFDLVLPDGITVATDEDGMIVTLGSRAATSHTVAKRVQNDGSIRIVCSSNSNAVFSGNTGSIVLVKLNVSNQMADGDYEVTVRNIELSSEDGVAFHPDRASATISVGGVIMGDVDSNGSVTINDAVWIVHRILNNTPEGFVEAAADVDGNGTISINDKVVLINRYILKKNYAATRAASADNNATLSFAEFDMVPGQTRNIEVMMSTTRTDIEALQCDIYLPEGLEFVAKEENGEHIYAEKGGRATNSHSISSNIQEDGALRVVESSDEGAAFRQNDKPVFTITVKAKDDVKVGKHSIRLANMELSYGQPINPADVNVTINIDKLGDVNNDGNVNQSDISALAELILSGTYKPCADLDGNGQVNAVDLVLLTNEVNKE